LTRALMKCARNGVNAELARAGSIAKRASWAGKSTSRMKAFAAWIEVIPGSLRSFGRRSYKV
jgi:hypothetical protein